MKRFFGVPKSMVEMAKVFRMPLWEKIRYLYLPALFGKSDK